MTSVRKTLPYEEGFPLALVYRDTKSPQTELPDHLHDWYELVYVYSGEGTFLIDQSLYTMSEGDLFLIPGGTIHHARPDEQQPVTSTALFLLPLVLPSPSGETEALPLACFAYARQYKQYRLQLPSRVREAISSLMEDIHTELEDREAGYRQAVRLSCMRLLLAVYRLQHSRAPAVAGQSQTAGPQWMRESLLHIDIHPEEDLGLSRLARLASVTPAHYSRVFKQLTGMTVSSYVTAKRMQRAAELLLHTDHPVKSIAELCGVDSMSYFHRMFRQHNGTTPLAFKRRFLTPDSIPSPSDAPYQKKLTPGRD
ncbi:AraC family transcriptional regulator [Paenibacillus sp. 1P07SE]|uniref:AraC family transcriptional regulator n=1 Tax=Paenibacillus sp. 1P07SE TaxID=3132209 RepID=UPI0039A6B315